MGTIIEKFFEYIRSRSAGRLIVDAMVVLAMSTWLGLVWITCTNFNTVKDLIEHTMEEPTDKVDVRAANLLDERINLELEALRGKVSGSRSYLDKYHDGKKDLNGMHFVYTSRTNEVLDHGISAEVLHNQNLPLSMFSTQVTDYLAHRCWSAISIRPASTSLFAFLKEQGVNSMIVCPVSDVSGELIGTVGVDWVIADINKENVGDALKSVQETATRIGGIVSLKPGS